MNFSEESIREEESRVDALCQREERFMQPLIELGMSALMLRAALQETIDTSSTEDGSTTVPVVYLDDDKLDEYNRRSEIFSQRLPRPEQIGCYTDAVLALERSNDGLDDVAAMKLVSLGYWCVMGSPRTLQDVLVLGMRGRGEATTLVDRARALLDAFETNAGQLPTARWMWGILDIVSRPWSGAESD